MIFVYEPANLTVTFVAMLGRYPIVNKSSVYYSLLPAIGHQFVQFDVVDLAYGIDYLPQPGEIWFRLIHHTPRSITAHASCIFAPSLF